MKSIRNAAALPCDEVLKIMQTIENHFQTFETIAARNIESGSSPVQVVAEFAAAVGEDNAAATVATLVNAKAWDGRISRNVAAWAASVPDAWDPQTVQDLSLYTQVHPAHLNQIARAMMNR